MSDLTELVEGYKRFRSTTYPEKQSDYRVLAEQGQSPGTMVIACCDSRVDPTIIFGAGPGSLFVVRNVANLVPPFEPQGDYHGTSAALEFAVTGLRVKRILVLGHARCGGIRAFLESRYDGTASDLFIGKWMSIMKPARGYALAARRKDDSEDAQRTLEKAGIGISLDNLRTFPFVQEALRAGSLSLHGAYFDIGSGVLYRYREADESFLPFDEAMSDEATSDGRAHSEA